MYSAITMLQLTSCIHLSLSLSLSLCACAGCLGQGEFLTVDVEPVSTSSVRASFMPPNATINYTVQYWFGDMGSERRSGSVIVPVNGEGVQTVVLTDPMPTPGTRVEVQINSTLNLTYPITVASTCNPRKYICILKK